MGLGEQHKEKLDQNLEKEFSVLAGLKALHFTHSYT
jgi:hypothetical protein